MPLSLASEALTHVHKGELADAEQKLYQARELLRKPEQDLTCYEGPPWWQTV